MRSTRLPRPRGELTAALFAALRAGGDFRGLSAKTTDEDAALALWVLHELHYRGLADVDEGLEWDADLIRLRGLLEADLEARLRSRYYAPDGLSFVDDALEWIDGQDGPSLARHVHRDADREQVLDLLAVRSIYHLKESDPVAWLVPRLGVREPGLQVQARERAEPHVRLELRLLVEQPRADRAHGELLVHGVGLHVLGVVGDHLIGEPESLQAFGHAPRRQ